MKRYALTLSMYVYADNDGAAYHEAERLAAEIDRKYDNKCSVAGMTEAPYGKVGKQREVVKEAKTV